MKKIIIFLIIVISIVCIFIGIKIRSSQIEKLSEEQTSCINEELFSEENSETSNTLNDAKGITLTMLGGSNMEDRGNINSMGYFILTQNNELVFIDGGRDIDAELVMFYINKYGNGKVDHWFVTHPHTDHAGALLRLLAEDNNLEIKNIYYSLLEDEWYKENDKRGYETAHTMIERLSSSKIKNRISCQEGQNIQIDNIICEIIRTANPEVTNSDNGNDASMVFKITATDVNKSVIFLGDSYVYVSKELMENPEAIKADSVQMAHHGQNGVTKEVYEAINPEVCFFNCPKYLYENDNGGGYNSGKWQSIEVRSWIEEMGAKSYAAYEGDQTFKFTADGIIKIEE